MITRREVLGFATAGAAFPLTSCSQLSAIFSPSPVGAVDIHNHIFNGRDLPVTGFLRQVVFREPHEPIRRDYLTESFLKMVALILLSGTPSPEAEMKQLAQGRTRERRDILLQDESNVARGLEEFQRQSDDQDVLGLVERELGLSQSFGTSRSEVGYPERLAREIYREGVGERTTSGRSRISASGILQTIRWAGLLTRPRHEIFNELRRLYGKKGEIRIFSPSLVDLQSWLLPEDNVSDLRAQIDVTSRIASLNKEHLILSFAPFCPLRAALEAEDKPGIDTLRHVKHAVQNGFAGVKIYPPMGFLPLGNAGLDRPKVRRWPAEGGVKLDEQLKLLYNWCVREDVPIKAHANNSIAAQICSGKFASPRNWMAVLSKPEYRRLRLNMAHFGGFDETRHAGKPCSDNPGGNWEVVIADMIQRYPNLYFDLGYWIEILDPKSQNANDVIVLVKALLERSPLIADRMMYGSDWSMVGREPGHNRYKESLQSALGELFPGNKINAMRFSATMH